jgi:serine/threonine protein kinase
VSRFTLEGQTLGKYRLLNALGRGGMAQVYRGYHAGLDRYVAVKVLRTDLMEHTEFLERFRREAHAVSGLRHPNIVQVFDFDVQDDIYYMVMELLDGDTLRARLHEYRGNGERMPLKEIAHILSDVLAGLEYAHKEGLIHRDLKPANILLTRKGQAVLTDFGIAQMLGSTQLTVSGALMGTLHYMAPEQGLKGVCDERSDLYSMGIVLFEMLTGFPPFNADTPLAILMKHLNDPLPLPRQLDPDLPLAFEELVLKALAKAPEERFQSAAAMAAALENVLPVVSPEPRPSLAPPARGVFSGDARQEIADYRFAREDTERDLPRPVAGIGSPSGSSSLPLRRIFDSPPSTLAATLGGAGVILFSNLFAAMFLTVTRINLFRYGWPFEIFLVAGLLSLLGWALSKPWLLNPAILLLGNGTLLAYSAVTGRWQDWGFLWTFELLFIAAAILFPLSLQKRKTGGGYLSRASSLYLTLIAMALSVGACWLSLVISLFR